MAYSLQPLDAALDTLGANYTDGVPIEISSKCKVDYNFFEFEVYLSSLNPQTSSLELSYDVGLEKKVLEDLAAGATAREKKEEEMKTRLEEYEKRLEEERERKRKEEEEEKERKRKEEEEKALEDERKRFEEIERERLLREAKEKEEAEAENDDKDKEENAEAPPQEEASPAGAKQESGSSSVNTSIEEEPETCNKVIRPTSDSFSPISSSGQSPQVGPQGMPFYSGAGCSLPNGVLPPGLMPPNGYNAVRSPSSAVNGASGTSTSSSPGGIIAPTMATSRSSAAVGGLAYPAPVSASVALSAGLVHNQPKPSQPISSTSGSTNASQHVNINYSDFEGEADPFADLELKTLNDMAELQTILSVNQRPVTSSAYPAMQHPYSSGKMFPTSQYPGTYPAYSQHHASLISSTASPAYHTQHQPHPTNTVMANSNAVSYPYQQPSGTVQPAFGAAAVQPPPRHPHQQYPLAGGGEQFRAAAARSLFDNGAERVGLHAQRVAEPAASHVRSVSSERSSTNRSGYHHAAAPTHGQEADAAEPGSLKSSRSLGNILNELKNEAQYLADVKSRNGQKTPPLRLSSTGSSGVASAGASPPNNQQKPSTPAADLTGLADDERRMVLQLGEMGFPIHRLAKAVRKSGADSQQLINYCVLVDRFAELGWIPSVIEEVVLLQNSNEKKSRKHYDAYLRLKELGFRDTDIHESLVKTELDYEKALGVLLS